MDLDLAGRVVVVTGATGGLGAETARTLLAEGAKVAVCGRSPEGVESARRELEQLGDVLCVTADIRDPESTANFLDAVLDRWGGRVDGLVNNAGGHSSASFVDLDDARWTEDYELKVLGATRTLRHLYPALARSGGSVVNVLSISARAPEARSMPTSITRAAGLALTKALSREWGPDQIRVNAILVGNIRSGQHDRAGADKGLSGDDVLAARARDLGIPIGRGGRADEFAALVAFLMSPRSGYLTGAAIPLDGGLSPAP